MKKLFFLVTVCSSLTALAGVGQKLQTPVECRLKFNTYEEANSFLRGTEAGEASTPMANLLQHMNLVSATPSLLEELNMKDISEAGDMALEVDGQKFLANFHVPGAKSIVSLLAQAGLNINTTLIPKMGLGSSFSFGMENVGYMFVIDNSNSAKAAPQLLVFDIAQDSVKLNKTYKGASTKHFRKVVSIDSSSQEASLKFNLIHFSANCK